MTPLPEVEGCPTCGGAGRVIDETSQRQIRLCDNPACERKDGTTWYRRTAERKNAARRAMRAGKD